MHAVRALLLGVILFVALPLAGCGEKKESVEDANKVLNDRQHGSRPARGTRGGKEDR